jgi:tetratricopeptide (TPR) repeat protein
VPAAVAPAAQAMARARTLLVPSMARWSGPGEVATIMEAARGEAAPAPTVTPGGTGVPPVRPTTSRWAAALADEAAAPGLGAAEPPAPGAYGLYGLRDLPVLGRFQERQAVWQEIRRCLSEGLPRVVVLEGAPGAGKSRLARDVIERGEQLGLLEGLQTWWSAAPSGDDGLRGLLENALDCRGASSDEVVQRLGFWLLGIPGDHELFARDVRLFLRPPPDLPLDAGLPLRAALELLERASMRRPVLLWLDDAQWGAGEAPSLLRRLLGRADLPVCVVATVRRGEPQPAALAALATEPRVRTVSLDRLDEEATRALVRGLLDVDDELAELLATRAEGNPLFAAQLLHQLVQAEALERREGRYRLAGAFDLARIPADIGALWEERIRLVVPDERRRLALAALAVVRARVSPPLLASLRDVVHAEGADAAAAFEAALAAARAGGLVVDEEGALRFAHGLLRDHLIASIPAREAPLLHARAAEALAPLAAAGEDCELERAEHWRLAERPARMGASLRAALDWSRARGDSPEIRARGERVLRDVAPGEGASDAARAHALVQLGRLDHMQGKLDDAEARLDEALKLGGPRERFAAREQQAFVLRRRGRVDEALTLYETLAAEATATGDRDAQGRALYAWAEALRRQGKAAEARSLYERAEAAHLGAGNARLASYPRRALGWLELEAGDLEEAGRSLAAARDVFVRFGDAQGEQNVESALAAWREARGEDALQTAHLERSLLLAKRLDLAYFAAFAHVNLGLHAARRGELTSAAFNARAAEAIAGGLASHDVQTAHAFLVVEVASSDGHEASAAEAFARAKAYVEKGGLVVADLSLSLARAAACAERRGWTGLAAEMRATVAALEVSLRLGP